MIWTIIQREESMTLSAHKIMFSLITLAALLGFGWIMIIYVLSFHTAQRVIDRIDGSYAPRRPALRRVARGNHRAPNYRNPYLRA
jgi:hypothetical protein